MTVRWKPIVAVAVLICGLASIRRDRPMEKALTVPVRGRVVLPDGSPVPGGRVLFHLTVNPDDPAAFAELDRDGSFAACTYGRGDGALRGSYILTVQPLSYKTGNPRPVAGASRVPSRYLSEATSDLHVDVTDGENDLGTIRLRP